MSVQVKGSGTIGGLDEGLVVSGIVTASTQINVGSNIKVGSAGVVTATSFVGSGANLTGITQTTINNNANNRIITGSGTANTLEGEANLTFDGNLLKLQCDSGEFRVEAANGVDAFSVDSDNGNTVIAGELDLTGKCLTSFGGNSTNEASCIKVGYEGSSKGQIRVYGADASTTGSLEFKVCESDGSDDHVILMNQKGSLLVGSTAQYGANAKDLSDGGLAITSAGENSLKVLDSTASAANVGGAILLGGNYRSDGDTQPFVELKSFKHNSTNADYSYGFKISATVYGASITDRYIVHSEGTVDHEFKTRTGAGILDLFNSGNVNISDGNLIVANGHGIDFSARADTGTGETVDSSLLDDYEEGSFTASFNGNDAGGTARDATGYYTKVGDLVHIDIMLGNADGSSFSGGYIKVSGMPFVCKRDTRTTNIFTYAVGFNTSRRPVFNMSDGDSYLWGYYSVDDGAWQPWPTSDFDSSAIYCRITMTYKAD